MNPVIDLTDFVIDALDTFSPKYFIPYTQKDKDIYDSVNYIIDVAENGYYPPSANEKNGLRFVLCILLRSDRGDLIQAIEEREIQLHKLMSTDPMPYLDCALVSRDSYGVRYILYYYNYPQVVEYIQNYLTYKYTSTSILEAVWQYLDHNKLKYDLEQIERNNYQESLYELL